MAPYIQNYSNGNTYKVIENNQGELSCIIKGGNLLATLTWTCFNTCLGHKQNGRRRFNYFTIGERKKAKKKERKKEKKK
jgi:hypothetical protein